MGQQMPDVNCKYGAPMGRVRVANHTAVKVRLFKVRINSGGYDDGGAYWGIGEPLYCAQDDWGDFCEYIRAQDRETAKSYFIKNYPDLKFYR